MAHQAGVMASRATIGRGRGDPCDGNPAGSQRDGLRLLALGGPARARSVNAPRPPAHAGTHRPATESRLKSDGVTRTAGVSRARPQVPTTPRVTGTSDGNGLRDPACWANKTQPLHRWVPWIAGFSAHFVQQCFDTFLTDHKPASTRQVLDPFAGVGTTLVQARLNGFGCTGFELNPYAALACQVKVNAPELDVAAVEAACREYQQRVCADGQPVTAPPSCSRALARPGAGVARLPMTS